MQDLEKQTKFVALRAQGWSYLRIAQELDVHRNTILNWSRQFRTELQNQKALQLDALLETALGQLEKRVQLQADFLRQLEAEIARRDLHEVPLSQLYDLAAKLRQQIRAELPPTPFVTPLAEIPPDELPTQVLDWYV